MRVVGVYSFKQGREVIENHYHSELSEVYEVIQTVDATQYKTKVSREKTMPGRLLYHPSSLNAAFRTEFLKRGWHSHKVTCDYPTEFYVDGYQAEKETKGAYRDMDFVKNRVGVEVQFGKYSFMVYNVCAKMTIFHKLDIIDVGIEIVPVKVLADEMSTGVSYFEQFVWDLEHRGVADIDIPVLFLGITI